MIMRKLHKGQEDGLNPLEAIQLDKIDSFSDLVRAMSRTAFTGRTLGQALEVSLDMWRDPDCSVILTLSGAMTVAKQGLIICDMIERGLVQAIVSTGALIAHGLTESLGHVHYAVPETYDDDELFAKGYNRIYDTLEMESNLDYVEALISKVLDATAPENGVWSSALFCAAVGKHLHENDLGRGFLKSAWEKNVPVFIPAFTDSEVGLDFSIWAMKKAWENGAEKESNIIDPATLFKAVPSYNPFLDLQEYARFIGRQQKIGIFTIGGGVPRNWAQQVSPYYDIACGRLGVSLEAPRFSYGVRICPEPAHWGGLSGCTYSEGTSWGKFLSPKEGGRFAEVSADATLAWPLLMKAVFEELDRD
jgi:deoxyhypusine synthase